MSIFLSGLFVGWLVFVFGRIGMKKLYGLFWTVTLVVLEDLITFFLGLMLYSAENSHGFVVKVQFTHSG